METNASKKSAQGRCADALTQYRVLLAQYGAVVAQHTARSIAGVRHDAATDLLANSNLSLCDTDKAENHYADLNVMFAPDLGVNINRLPITTEAQSLFRCGVPALSSLIGVTVNDTFHPTDRLVRLLPEGVTVTAFSKASTADEEVIRRHYGNVAGNISDNAALALNTALAQDGVLVHVSTGVKVDKPIQLINILRNMTAPDGTALPALAVRRLLVVLERGANLDLMVCDHDMSQDTPSASSRVTEIHLDTDSSLNLCELEESSVGTSRHVMTFARQNDHSRLSVFAGSLKPSHTRNDFTVNLNRPGASVDLNGMAILDGNRIADNCTTVLHNSEHCHSDQAFKYLVNDAAKGAFHGLIRVAEGATGTSAYQSNRNIIGGADAVMHSQPQLEIYCDDVKCSHGSATGQLDENALFYMRSRGIDLPEARSMLMNAFMADVLEKVNPEQMRDRLRHLVERRLSGADEQCGACTGC